MHGRRDYQPREPNALDERAIASKNLFLRPTRIMKTILVLLLVVVLSGCKDTPAPPTEIQSVTFSGVKLPGRAADAKAAGFTTCTEDYYNFTCQAKGFSVLGITPAKASLSLTGRAVFATDRTKVADASGDVRLLPVQSLAYDEIRLDFVFSAYDEKCVARTARGPNDSYRGPLACLKAGNSIENFREKLQKASWVKVNDRRRDVYMHLFEDVSVTLHNDNASISRVDPAHKASALANFAKREAEAKAKTDAGRAFVENMAK